jgi:hypothetical protein
MCQVQAMQRRIERGDPTYGRYYPNHIIRPISHRPKKRGVFLRISKRLHCSSPTKSKPESDTCRTTLRGQAWSTKSRGPIRTNDLLACRRFWRTMTRPLLRPDASGTTIVVQSPELLAFCGVYPFWGRVSSHLPASLFYIDYCWFRRIPGLYSMRGEEG